MTTACADTRVVRPATEAKDLEVMVHAVIEENLTRSWFASLPYAFTAEDVQKWYVSKVLTDASYCLYVVEEHGEIVGGCGGMLDHQILPPHLRFVTEWGWWGDKRAATVVWRAVEDWGKARGAVLSCYRTQGDACETLSWRAL